LQTVYKMKDTAALQIKCNTIKKKKNIIYYRRKQLIKCL